MRKQHQRVEDRGVGAAGRGLRLLSVILFDDSGVVCVAGISAAEAEARVEHRSVRPLVATDVDQATSSVGLTARRTL